MLERICDHIHNYFARDEDKRSGTFTVTGGALALDNVAEGQYFRIVGSVFNDGVYQYPATCLRDETFEGEIWPMRPPRDFLSLCEEIEDWQEKYGEHVDSPFQSENVIGVYSYTRAAASGNGAASGGWEGAFKARLNRWRRQPI